MHKVVFSKDFPIEARFPNKIRCYVNDKNDYSSLTFVTIDENNVCSIITEKEITDMLVSASFSLFKIMPEYVMIERQASACARTIMSSIATERDYKFRYAYRINRPKDIAFLSDHSYCFEKLDFDPSEGPTPIWDSIMSRVDNNSGLQAFIGSLFSKQPSSRSQYLYLWGPGGAGKSVIATLLKRLLGRSYTTSSQPSKDDKFFTSILVGKRLCYISEASESFQTSNLFKSWTGEESIKIEFKNKQPFSANIDTKFMFTSNNQLIIDNRSENTRRAIVCEIKPLEEKYRIEENELMNKLMKEAPHIIYKCTKIFEENVVKGMIITNDNERILKKIAEQNVQFAEEIFEECFEVDPNGTIMLRELLALYRYYNFNNKKAHYFKEFLLSKGIKIVRPRQNQERKRLVLGVKWNVNSFFYRKFLSN